MGQSLSSDPKIKGRKDQQKQAQTAGQPQIQGAVMGEKVHLLTTDIASCSSKRHEYQVGMASPAVGYRKPAVFLRQETEEEQYHHTLCPPAPVYTLVQGLSPH